MSSRRGGGKPFVSSNDNNPSSKGKSASEFSSSNVEQLSQGVVDMSLDPVQDDGEWEVISRKSKNRAGSSAAKTWGPQNSNPRLWGGLRNNGGLGRGSGNSAWVTQTTDSRTVAGRGNVRPQSANRSFENNYVTSHPAIRPPLEHGWNWQSRAGYAASKGFEDGQGKDDVNSKVQKVNDGDDDDDDDDDNDDELDAEAIEDSEDELLSDEFDSDTSQKSHETRKKNRWFKKFFEDLDGMSMEVINEPARQWHCPACQGGPGSIEWYPLQSLIAHAKTKRAKRALLHRELAKLLDEELCRRGSSIVPAGETFGKWRGLIFEEKDHEIVWPPMVVIMNTRLERDENEKWIGMGNQELLDTFSSYAAVKARHSYGPQGHRGMSVLIFESSATGYFEAERLHKHFSDQGTGREAWDRHRVFFHSGGKRQLYGFMAVKAEDLDIFNQHSQGRSRLKFEMRSYQEMVVKQFRQMTEDNQELIWYKNRVAKVQRAKNTVEESLGKVSEKLRLTMQENHIIQKRTKMQHELNKEELDLQEEFFKEQIKIMHQARDEKKENFEKLQLQELEKVKQSNKSPSDTGDYRSRAEEIAKLIKLKDEEMEAFEAEREKLIKVHQEKMAAMRQRHREEEVKLEEEFDAELNSLMEKGTPHGSELTTKGV